VATKKSFPLRINPEVLAAMQRWADDELRSVNAQIEYVLRDALVKAGRVKLTQKVVTNIEETNVEETKIEEPNVGKASIEGISIDGIKVDDEK